ncbi:hypothetical protein D3OALGA1CA_2641 [Olavius algarvensis associated proteobacterium Delta 3]|nr:hypothetical protein D3OALGA1CA_2641 [Olavius algarvensis associated proteobacterium Delta 3]CAB5131937.1 hypothetical protein D3OALGB2SA_3691 [Olavius algarvensis associated proteobacterium Delta 3]
MSQIIAFKSKEGIVLASDGKAIDFKIGGGAFDLEVQRLFALTSHSAVLTGGAAQGESICRSLKTFIEEEDLSDIDAIYQASLPFLASEYETFMRKTCEVLPVDPIHQLYFILAGYLPGNDEAPFRLYLIWPKNRLPYLDGEEISSAFSVPRIMRLEYHLAQLSNEGAPLDHVLTVVRQALENQAETQDEIAGPFSYATITRDGYQSV